jgi:hypothetical protein
MIFHSKDIDSKSKYYGFSDEGNFRNAVGYENKYKNNDEDADTFGK